MRLAPDLLPVEHRKALNEVCQALDHPEIEWAVSGSVALALQGLATPCGDLDLVLGVESVDVVARLLAEDVEEPMAPRARGGIRGVLGRARLGGVAVELLADLRNELPDGSWTEPLDVGALRAWGEVDGCRCPVIPVSALEHAYQLMGRMEQARAIAMFAAGR
jgi:hypothetical protein